MTHTHIYTRILPEMGDGPISYLVPQDSPLYVSSSPRGPLPPPVSSSDIPLGLTRSLPEKIRNAHVRINHSPGKRASGDIGDFCMRMCYENRFFFLQIPLQPKSIILYLKVSCQWRYSQLKSHICFKKDFSKTIICQFRVFSYFQNEDFLKTFSS